MVSRYRLERLSDEIMRENPTTLRRITGAVRRVRASGAVNVTMCIDPVTKEITEWAYGFGGRPVLYCREGEEEISVYFRTPNYFLSRKDVADRIAEELAYLLGQ